MCSHGKGKRVRRRQATEAANERGGLELHRGGMHPPFGVSEPQPAFSPETPREDAATCADRIGPASCAISALVSPHVCARACRTDATDINISKDRYWA